MVSISHLLAWIKSFLSNRYQRVYIGSTLSTPLPVISGVPQGSVLGKLLILMISRIVCHHLLNLC